MAHADDATKAWISAIPKKNSYTFFNKYNICIIV